MNSFLNVGFGTDSLLVNDPDKSWLFKTKEEGRMSAVASLGLIYLWDPEEACNQFDRLLSAEQESIKAGAYLGIGLASSGTRSIYDFASTLISEHVAPTNSPQLRIGAILG